LIDDSGGYQWLLLSSTAFQKVVLLLNSDYAVVFFFSVGLVMERPFLIPLQICKKILAD